MEVNSVSIENYNANPYSYLKNEDGSWKIDVIFFGTWDGNNGKGINQTSFVATEEFILAGKGVIFGHDTIHWGNATTSPAAAVYFNQLAKYVNITPNNYYAENKHNLSDTVKITKKDCLPLILGILAN